MIRLADEEHGVEAWITPERGNRVASLCFAGQNILHEPGIPFLAPWANRMPEGFHANGRFYPLNRGMGNLQIDSATGIAIHGLLAESGHWETVHSDASSITSRLQFWRYPELMAHWPFAHEYEMTFRLGGGALEISLTVTNLSDTRMPVAVGFHPYFTIPGVPRAQWRVRVPARLRVVHDEGVLPTGELVAADLPEFAPLADYRFDSGYTSLEEKPRFRIEGGGKAIEIRFGPTWPVAIVWGPEGEEFLCVEPMAAVTNGINLYHRGLWQGLQEIQPGAAWNADFRISAEGFCDTEPS